MKLSAHHKRLGDRVFLNRCASPDLVYVSCVFTWNRGKTTFYPDATIGGTGVSLDTILPYEIEHIMPDYSLYGCDYSVGFTSRGCIRSCPWCVVPKKEGWIHDEATLSEFVHSKHRKVMLLDGNLLATPSAKRTLHELAERQLKVCFDAGLDIRLVTDEIAQMLAACDYRSRNFRERRLYFAFDEPKTERAVSQGIERLLAAGIKPRHLMFYILTGFNTSLDEDLHRIKLIQKCGADPYVMKYNNRQSPQLNALARWTNKAQIRKTVPFEQYTRRKIPA